MASKEANSSWKGDDLQSYLIAVRTAESNLSGARKFRMTADQGVLSANLALKAAKESRNNAIRDADHSAYHNRWAGHTNVSFNT